MTVDIFAEILSSCEAIASPSRNEARALTAASSSSTQSSESGGGG